MVAIHPTSAIERESYSNARDNTLKQHQFAAGGWSRLTAVTDVDNAVERPSYPREVGRSGYGKLVAGATEYQGLAHGKLVAQTYIILPIVLLPGSWRPFAVDNSDGNAGPGEEEGPDSHAGEGRKPAPGSTPTLTGQEASESGKPVGMVPIARFDAVRSVSVRLRPIKVGNGKGVSAWAESTRPLGSLLGLKLYPRRTPCSPQPLSHFVAGGDGLVTPRDETLRRRRLCNKQERKSESAMPFWWQQLHRETRVVPYAG